MECQQCTVTDPDLTVFAASPVAAPAMMIKQGAEAKLFVVNFLGRKAVMKERISKEYRHPFLDSKIRRNNMMQEARSIIRCQKAGVPVPVLYLVDPNRFRIYMEHIDGVTAKDFFWSLQEAVCPESLSVAASIGRSIARLHDAELIHGDLTTSNFIVRSAAKLIDSEHVSGIMGRQLPNVVIIDFGLSSTQPLPEDKAVDLYVLERAFISSHPNSQPLVIILYPSQSESPVCSMLMKCCGHIKQSREELIRYSKDWQPCDCVDASELLLASLRCRRLECSVEVRQVRQTGEQDEFWLGIKVHRRRGRDSSDFSVSQATIQITAIINLEN